MRDPFGATQALSHTGRLKCVCSPCSDGSWSWLLHRRLRAEEAEPARHLVPVPHGGPAQRPQPLRDPGSRRCVSRERSAREATSVLQPCTYSPTRDPCWRQHTRARPTRRPRHPWLPCSQASRTTSTSGCRSSPTWSTVPAAATGRTVRSGWAGHRAARPWAQPGRCRARPVTRPSTWGSPAQDRDVESLQLDLNQLQLCVIGLPCSACSAECQCVGGDQGQGQGPGPPLAEAGTAVSLQLPAILLRCRHVAAGCCR